MTKHWNLPALVRLRSYNDDYIYILKSVNSFWNETQTFYKITGHVIIDDEDLGENMLLNCEPVRMDATDSLYWDFQWFWYYNLSIWGHPGRTY